MAAKVCILTTVHPPFDTRIFHKQAKTLARAGYEVVLIAQHDREEVIDGVHIIPLPKPRNRLARMLGLTWKAFRLALKEKADAYHFHDPELLLVGVLLAVFARAPVIYDVHENVRKQILNKFWIPKFLRWFVAYLYLLIEHLALKFISAIIIAEDSYTENYSDDPRVVAIRNYPFLLSRDRFSEPRWRKFGEDSLLYVGGVSKIRGIFELIEAISLLKKKGYDQVRLVVGGPFLPVSLEKEILSRIRKYDLSKAIKLLGKISYAEVISLLAQSEIGLAVLHPDPNYIESLPTKLFEYMMAGLPVVASNFPLWREIVEGHQCGLCVDPLNPQEIADAIEWLINHPEEARKMGENGRRAVEEKYNWEREAEKLLQLYARLLA